MEGPLSKWTNVMQGWQYRWFVLSESTLDYYTSREKMVRGQKRGCVRLMGAVLGIDDENNALFTVTVDNKMFHFQARDEHERDRWIRALEISIHRHSGYYRPRLPPSSINTSLPVSVVDFDKNIAEADQYLQLMIIQVNNITDKADKADTPDKRLQLRAVLDAATAMLETVKHGVVLLQMAKSQICTQPSLTTTKNTTTLTVTADSNNDVSSDDDEDLSEGNNNIVPPTSYSSSDDDDTFFDTREDSNGDDHANTATEHNAAAGDRRPSLQRPTSVPKTGDGSNPEPDYGDDGEDFDRVCDDTEEKDVGNVQEEHGSVLVHLLSQVSIGMDLTKVTLPTFILERRSLLEMYADFFAHPDDFVSTTDLSTPEERMIGVVRYYLSAFYAARKSGVAKKPYNPILGETFRCRWDVPGLELTGERIDDGPFPGSDVNQLTFMAEQVSHHPPISAFYAEHPGKKISFSAHIWTKSSFLGLSIGVHNVGQGCVTLHEHGEQYIVTFPSGYGRSIMTTPWVELGGKVKITCPQTGYYADVEFLTKPFFGGKPHRVGAEIFRPGMKKPIVSVKGEWNGVLLSKTLGGGSEDKLFMDVQAKPEVKKQCKEIALQEERESRRLWRHVTVALKRNRINMATAAKRWIEQRQRDETKDRQARGQQWKTINFHLHDDLWQYDRPLASRLPSS